MISKTPFILNYLLPFAEDEKLNTTVVIENQRLFVIEITKRRDQLWSNRRNQVKKNTRQVLISAWCHRAHPTAVSNADSAYRVDQG